MLRQSTEKDTVSESKEITAEQLAKLLKENEALKASLQQATEAKQASEKTLSERDEELRKLQSASLHFQSVADQKSTNLEQVNAELKSTQKKLESSILDVRSLKQQRQDLQGRVKGQEEQISAAGKMLHQKSSQLAKSQENIESLQSSADTLEATKAELEKKLKEAEQKAAKTPRWKIVLGVGLFIAAGLLTATGVGAVITGTTAAIVGLGYAAFVVGSTTLVGEFMYGLYKGIKACCFPSSKQSADQDTDLSTNSESTNEPDSPVHAGRRTSQPQLPLVSERQNRPASSSSNDSTPESKREDKRDRHSHATNRNLLNATTPDAVPPKSHVSSQDGRASHKRQH